MLFFALLLITSVITITGLVMVNVVGNYENHWGVMLFWGGAAAAVLWFIWLAKLIFMLMFVG